MFKAILILGALVMAQTALLPKEVYIKQAVDKEIKLNGTKFGTKWLLPASLPLPIPKTLYYEQFVDKKAKCNGAEIGLIWKAK